MLSSSSGAVCSGIKMFMLDWFSRQRLVEEQDQSSNPPVVGDVLPEMVLRTLDGGLFFLSELQERFVLLVLPFQLLPTHTYLLSSFAGKLHEVRPEITRLVVVTRPAHLSTVVALAGDMLILSDESGDAVLQLAPADPTLYFVGDHRQIMNIAPVEDSIPGFIPRSLRPAA